jgi:hypothetical protein
MPTANFIIAGAAKSATSSVFKYLSEHPDVCASSVKETLFFIKDYKGGSGDAEAYAKYFSHAKGSEKIIMEATPSYMPLGAELAGRINRLSPGAKVLFILRNPVDRVYSVYNYNVNLMASGFDNVSFGEYIGLCEDFSVGRPVGKIKSKHLGGLDDGKYARYIKEYMETLGPERVIVMFYEDLESDSVSFMRELCNQLGIDPSFYDAYQFSRENVTPRVRSKRLHKLARKARNGFWSLIGAKAQVEGKIGGLYGRLNESRDGHAPMSHADRVRLEKYYAPYNRELKALLKGRKRPAWVG